MRSIGAMGTRYTRKLRKNLNLSAKCVWNWWWCESLKSYSISPIAQITLFTKLNKTKTKQQQFYWSKNLGSTVSARNFFLRAKKMLIRQAMAYLKRACVQLRAGTRHKQYTSFCMGTRIKPFQLTQYTLLYFFV